MAPERTAQETAISVRDLSKKYRRFSSTADTLKELLHPFGKKYHDEFWALKGVSFEIKKGESIGLIGRNGSGKSTLLQVLCGILQPTSGTVLVSGRVAALLELGAGFSSDFSGRENVYMNGALMGLSRHEMDERFSSIAEFAEIGDFMEQPVKTYSSGMYVRLAFAVAINVDADILIVDEALSVGDEAFQRKCYSRIRTIQDRGATIIFVSHSASAVVELCNRAILLERGEVLLKGAPKKVVSNYQKLIYAPVEGIEELRREMRSIATDDEDSVEEASRPETEVAEAAGQGGDKDYYDPSLIPKSTVYYEQRGAEIRNPRVTTLEGETVNILTRGKEYVYTYDVHFTEDAHLVRCGMMIKTKTGFELGGIVSHSQGNGVRYVKKNAKIQPHFRFRCALVPEVFFLNAGVLGVIDGCEQYLHRCTDVAMFRVMQEKGLVVGGTVDFSVSRKTVIESGGSESAV